MGLSSLKPPRRSYRRGVVAELGEGDLSAARVSLSHLAATKG